MQNTSEKIARCFPIASQTSEADKLFLLNAIELIKSKLSKKSGFKYLEIGSYMGGSLTPFLMDEGCALAVSVDERERQQPDERGAKYDYAGITHQVMIDNLQSHGLDVAKLRTHDGSISTYNAADHAFDLAFIDGEHTDIACVRDFVWTYPMLKPDAMVIFHDSSIVYKALAIIQEILLQKKVPFKMLKDQASEMTAVFLGQWAQLEHAQIFGGFEDWAQFQSRAETEMLVEVVGNRVDFNVTCKIKPAPVFKA